MGWGLGGMITFVRLAHMLDATQLMGWGGGGLGGIITFFGGCNLPWTCTHVRCYAMGGVGWGVINFLLIVITQSFGQWRSKIRIGKDVLSSPTPPGALLL